MASISLLGSTSRVVTPYIKVQIGNYTFGVYQKGDATIQDYNGFYLQSKIQYPNYIKNLTITKINGQVNQYELNIVYPVTQEDDPNFFEKVFSSVSKSRKIIFSYGDMSLPTYVYKNEEAIITNVTSSFNIKSSCINYTVSAVSSAVLAQSGVYKFVGRKAKPSDVIKEILYRQDLGLQEIFYGMNSKKAVERLKLIPGDDAVVDIETKINITPFDYISYLVSCMIPASADVNTIKQQSFYILSVHDDITGSVTNNNVSETLGGPYFKITKVTKHIKNAEAYDIDIGFPSANIVQSFSVNNNENYSIFYDWLNDTETYIYKINANGEWEKIYSPILSSNNNELKTRTSDKTWWSKLTQYPITANIVIKGLLRPAILMSYVRLRVFFYGVEHINSGLYIITKQVDNVSESGYTTQLTMTRVSGAE